MIWIQGLYHNEI